MRAFWKFANVALFVVVSAPLISGCSFLAKPAEKIPTRIVAANDGATAQQLIIVLPGRGDTLKTLEKFAVADSIRRTWPAADILFAEVTLPYYMEGRAVQRIHDELVVPARAKGYRDIYLAGASMGGMGVLMYEREHPNEATGLILMAPYMGDAGIIKEIKSAGGLKDWEPGPAVTELSRGNVPREEWRLAKSWLDNRGRTQSVWLICGTKDQFHDAAKLIAELLPPNHYIEPQGGHAWTVWMDGAQRVFAQLQDGSKSSVAK